MSPLSPTLFLALRYLRPRRTFVSIITIISVLGVTLGVMVLIIVISVMTGFDHDLREKILGLNPHIVVTSIGPMRAWEQKAALIEKRPHMAGVSPFISSPVLAKFAGRAFAPTLWGVDPAREKRTVNLGRFVVDGKEGAGKLCLDGESAVIGIEMARRNGIVLGDKLLIYSPKNLEERKVAYLPAELIVTGIFDSGMYEYDAHLVFTSLETAQDLLGLENLVQGLGVMTDNLERVVEVQKDLNAVLIPPIHARTWMEMNRTHFSAVAVEKNLMFFLLIFIIIVAAFGITSNLITITVQKRREIGILKALGATPRNILSVFLIQGIIVGIIGTILGLASGLTVLYYRNDFLEFLRVRTGFEIFPSEIYQFTQLPSQTSVTDLVIICGSALVICTLAGLFPAWRAARLQPAAAIREY